MWQTQQLEAPTAPPPLRGPVTCPCLVCTREAQRQLSEQPGCTPRSSGCLLSTDLHLPRDQELP